MTSLSSMSSLTSTSRRRIAAGLLAAGVVLTVSGCGSDSTTATPGASSSSNATDQASVHNAADTTFINDMTPHHEGAVAMAELAPSRASSAQVKDLAARILAAQEPEITQMAGFAKAWMVTMESSMGGHGGMGGMDADTAALTPLKGTAFDKEFLIRMTAHHQGAVTMAKAELAAGQSAPAKALAQAIITAQEKEIAEMATLLAAL